MSRSLCCFLHSTTPCLLQRAHLNHHVHHNRTSKNKLVPALLTKSSKSSFACSNRQLSSSSTTTMSYSLPRVSSSSSNNNQQQSSTFDTLSKAIIIGRTGGIPELREFSSGSKCVNFSLATNHLNANSQVETQWHSIQIFDSVMGFNLLTALPSGTQMYVEGILRINNYEKNGVTKQYVNVVVNRAQGGMFRILRRPYKANNMEKEQNQSTTSDGSDAASNSNEFPF